ncbi:MAG: hypothetical protein RR855_03295 [Comamonas sp.]
MNDFAHTAARWAVRIFLLAAGAVFFLCLLAVASLLALVWGARALWAKLTGRTVMPWVMPTMRPGASWASTMAGAAPEASDSTDSKRSGVLASAARDITDVQPREVR